jgi:hypothetical protein
MVPGTNYQIDVLVFNIGFIMDALQSKRNCCIIIARQFRVCVYCSKHICQKAQTLNVCKDGISVWICNVFCKGNLSFINYSDRLTDASPLFMCVAPPKKPNSLPTPCNL